MAEIAISVIAKLTEYLVDPLGRQGQYLFCVAQITKTLENEKQKLAHAQDGVQKRVEEALKRTEKVDDVVEKWLDKVKNHIDEVVKLEQLMNIDTSCCQGRCPNWKRYRLCRQMAKKIDTTKQLLIARSDFKQFSFPAALPDIEYFSSGNFVCFQSTKLAFDQLLEALQDNSSYMIGLYGMGGSGKTTLVKEVGKKAKELKLFDRVLFATVSQTLDVRKIQGEIADMLGLKLDEETEPGRARRLSVRFNNGERILIILDDVWAKIKLEDIGIPFEDYHAGCKLLLTTRRQQVCIIMDCKRKIPLYLLSEEESLTLLQKHVGICDNSVNGVVQEVVRECKGLPIAIEAVGNSLKGKSIEEWKVALRRLRNSKPINVEEGVRDAFTCLRLSYDYLRSKEAKSLFLLCCMFPEDHDIFIEDLFKIGVGLGLCKEMDSLEASRDEMNVCINNLIDSCLLMHSEDKKNHLRMHDMIRDVALWIASQENHTIVVNLMKDLNALADDSAKKDYYAFSSWSNEIRHIPENLDAPKLEILLLKTMKSCELSKASFKSMEALKVVVIVIQNYRYQHLRHLPSLPQSMQLLTNLQTLHLEGLRLGDISWVASLKGVQILELKGSSFHGLPNVLAELKKLKLLDLSWCEIGEHDYKAIGRCTQLEELYAFGNQLSSRVLDYQEIFQNKVTFPKLQRYVLQIGDIAFEPMDLRTRTLYLRNFQISTSGPFIKYLLQRAEIVCLHSLNGICKNIVPNMFDVIGGMNELTSLWLHSCSDFKCFIDMTSHRADLFQAEALFPKLIRLKFHCLFDLKEVCCGPPLLCIFKKLQELHITSCRRLQSIFPTQMTLSNLRILKIEDNIMLRSLFTMSVAKTMLLLQKLTINRCTALKNIIQEDGIGTCLEIIPVPDNPCLVFPQLKFLSIDSCNELECIFPNSCVQGLEQLEEVCIRRSSQLKYVFGQHEYEHNEIQIHLPQLRLLRLNSLKTLLSIVPKGYHSSCPSLRELRWEKCPIFTSSSVNITVHSDLRMVNQLCRDAQPLQTFLKLEKLEVKDCSVQDILFSLEEVVLTNTDQQSKLTSSLHFLILKNLRDLKFIWTGPAQALSLQNLKELTVSGCNSLKTIFSPTILRSLQNLVRLSIEYCNELEKIISYTEVEEHHNPLNDHPPQMCFPNLKELSVVGCNKLKHMFSVVLAWDDLAELQYLSVIAAAQMEHVFGEWQNNEGKMILPNLRKLTLKEVPSLIDLCQGINVSSKCLPQVSSNRASYESSPQHRIQGLREVVGNDRQLSWQAPILLPTVLGVKELDIQDCGAGSIFYLHEAGHDRDKQELMVSKLERLSVKNLAEMNIIWACPVSSTQMLSLQHLQHLEVNQCGKLKSIFSMVVHRSLQMLTRLIISDCEELEEIITEHEEPRILSNTQMGFPKLRYLVVKQCSKLKSLFSVTMARMLPQLYSLSISECSQFEEVFRQKNEDFTLSGEEIALPKLSEIKLENLHEIVDICQQFKLHAVNLHKVTINDCPKFSAVYGAAQTIPLRQRTEESWVVGTSHSQWNREDSAPFPAILNVKDPDIQNCEAVKKFHILLTKEVKNAFHFVNTWGLVKDQPRLVDLTLECLRFQNLPQLRLIWTGHSRCLRLQYLRRLEVYHCNKLKSVFSEAIHGSLPLLTGLILSSCEELEGIITEEKESQILADAQICFPKLNYIKVQRCNKLKCLFSKAMTRMLPELCSLHISEAAKLEALFGHKSEGSSGNEETMVPQGPGPLGKDGNQMSDVDPTFVRPAIFNVQGEEEELKLEKLHELRFIWTVSIPSFKYLRRLRVNQCGKLKYIFSIVVHGSLPELECFSISECEELEEIIAEFEEAQDLSNMQICFPKLEGLVVERCNKLKRLFSTAIVQMLPKLKRINISEAAQLEEIYKLESKNESASGEEIVLPNLEIIYLGKLPSFTEVCRGLKLNTVKVQRVEIDQCPKLYSILGATQEIPFQRNTQEQWPHVMNDTDTQLCNEALFPATSNVQVLEIKNCGVVTIINLQGVGLIGDQQEILASDLRQLELENLPELRFIVTSTSHILNLKNLWSVKLSQCEKLKSVFTTAIIRSLPKLSSLVICECEELEEIITAIEEPQNPSDAQVFFPKLRKIEVKRCNKLRCLFSVTFAKVLPELNSLSVSEAAQLREVFEHRSEEGTTSSAEGIMLPSLETIKLKKLPLLIDVCKGFKLQANQVIINDCPNFHSDTGTESTDDAEHWHWP